MSKSLTFPKRVYRVRKSCKHVSWVVETEDQNQEPFRGKNQIFQLLPECPAGTQLFVWLEMDSFIRPELYVHNTTPARLLIVSCKSTMQIQNQLQILHPFTINNVWSIVYNNKHMLKSTEYRLLTNMLTLYSVRIISQHFSIITSYQRPYNRGKTKFIYIFAI